MKQYVLEGAQIKCPECGKAMPRTERYRPFRSTFYNCPTCHPELEQFRPKLTPNIKEVSK